jgi:AraC-like DNA-binding protein
MQGSEKKMYVLMKLWESKEHDDLTRMLREIRLRVHQIFGGSYVGTWTLTQPAVTELSLPTDAAGYLLVLTSGSAHLQVNGTSLPIGPGNIALLPRGDSWQMSAADPLQDPNACDDHAPTVVSAFVVTWEDATTRLLISGLPSAIHFHEYRPLHFPQLAKKWHHEPPEVLDAIAIILTGRVLRTHLSKDGPQRGGWLTGHLDAVLGPAIAAIHTDPATPWTVSHLAAKARVSRSLFAAHFRQVMGRPPMKYLLEYRMSRAKDLLRQERVGIKQVAAQVGYGSVAAFSTAFRMHVGVAPGRYRRDGERSGGDID